MYYVIKNECCSGSHKAIAFKSKKEAIEYMKLGDGRINDDLFIEEKIKDFPYYVSEITGDVRRKL